MKNAKIIIHYPDYSFEEFEVSHEEALKLVDAVTNKKETFTIAETIFELDQLSGIVFEDITLEGKQQTIGVEFAQTPGVETNKITVNIHPKEEEESSLNNYLLIHLAFMSMASFINEIVTKKAMRSRGLSEFPDNLGFELLFDTPLTAKEQKEYTQRLIDEIHIFLDTIGLPYVINVKI